MLLQKYENESIHYYNFYHKDDTVLTNPFVKWGLSNISRAINYFVPQSKKGQFVPLIQSFPNSSNPLIIVDATRRFCIIQHYIPLFIVKGGINTHASPLIAYPFFFKQLYTNGQRMKMSMPPNVELSAAFDKIITNTMDDDAYALRNAICNTGILYDLMDLKDAGNVGSAFITLAVPDRNGQLLQPGGGYKSLELKKTKQRYIVHIDKKLTKPYIRISNQRVYLCDIRNRYRYIY
jgi:hypothetical protein